MKEYRVKYWREDGDGGVEYVEFETWEGRRFFTTAWAGRRRSRGMWKQSTVTKRWYIPRLRFRGEVHMEEPVWKGHDLHLVEREPRPVIDVSYVELPEKLTYRIDASSILGAIAVFAMIAATGTAEENPLLSFLCTAVFAGCARLSIKEDGKKR